MTLAAALPIPTVILLGSAIANPLLVRWHRRLALILGVAASAAATAVLGVIATRVYAGTGGSITHFFSNERPIHGQALGIAFTAEPFGITFALLAAGIGTLLLLSALSEFGHLGERELGGLGCLMQLLLAALVAFALAADLVDMFVWFEVAALASYGLTGFFLERPIALEAAFKIAVVTSFAGFAFFVGAGMLYDRHGALNLGQLHGAVGANRADALALALLVLGLGTKAGLMPFHGWLPDAHTPVPGAVSALFSGLMVNMGIVGLVRVCVQVYRGPLRHDVLVLLTVLGLISAVCGAALALVQDDLKRLLAWDTVSQMGVLMIGFASDTEAGEAGALYHLINHALFKSLLFLCAGAIVHATGKTKLSELGGLARSRPLLTTAFTVGALAIAGIPPLNGFVSLGLVHEGVHERPLVLAIAVLAQVVTVAALARAAYLGFYRSRPEPYEHLEPTRTGMRVSTITLSVACIFSGAVPQLIARHVAGPGAAALSRPDWYAGAALGNSSTLNAVHLALPYGNLADYLLTAAEVALGLLIAVLVVRRGEPRLITPLRRLHTGSVNDYVAFSAAGFVITSAVLLGTLR